MSLVDQFDTRDFVNGRLIGGKYNEMTGNMAYSDISPYGGNRMAGSGIGLGPDVVTYMGEAAQGISPQNKSMDQLIGDGFLGALSQLVQRPEDKAEFRTLEYRPDRDGPVGIEPIGPYNPETDSASFDQLSQGFGDLAQNFDVTPGGDARRSRKGLTPGDVRRLMEEYPNDAEKIQKMYLPGVQLPKRV